MPAGRNCLPGVLWRTGMKALIAMSGGVDSSVAACFMKEKGYTGLGITMKLLGHAFTQEETGHRCCSLDDVEDARRVARQLDMPYYVFNFSRCFQDQVIDPWVQAYENGQTPNPCILCNRELKFGKLFQKARELGCSVMATGHYARVTYEKTTGRWLLKKAMDQAKDQSYFLYTMTQEQLQHTVFPLGHLTKAQVRQIAAQHGFANAHKHDSQDICFIGKEGCAGFLSSHAKTPCPKGHFVDREGHILGTHEGIWQYTIGQRRGLHLAAGVPLYVCAIDPVAHHVVVGPEQDLYSTTLTARNINLIALPKLERPMRLQAKIRSRHPEQWATVTQTDEDTLQVVFDVPQRAITKGQAVVLYDGDVVVGGGTIW